MKVECTELKGVGKKVADKLAALNIRVVQDLLFHLPLRYEDRTKIISIADAKVDENVLVEGRVIIGQVQYGGRRSFICTIKDKTGLIALRFFYFSAAQMKPLSTPGKIIRCYGAVRQSGKFKEIVHPEYQVIDEASPAPLTDRLTPIYPTTAGINQALLKKLISQAINKYLCSSLELFPDELLNQLKLPRVDHALKSIHSPVLDEDVYFPMQRLAFEELLAHQLSMKFSRSDVQKNKAYCISKSVSLVPGLLDKLHFELTRSQKNVIQEISCDLEMEKPMQRLLQGDVGSGKTIVALISALSVIESGKQVALMAPTEILAEQHYLNFKKYCDHMDVSFAWLSGSVKGKQRQKTLEKMINGEAQIIIGTHALFQADVNYHELGLIIIDEQHRFGVHQRLALYEKRKDKIYAPHQLVMTATPIPRSLAMTAYADLDCSIIDELPPGRTPVMTIAIDNQRRDEVIERVRSARKNNQQIYWVCTLIEESEHLQCQAAENTRDDLEKMLPEFTVGLLHGRMKPQEKEHMMRAFKNHEYDILVATTVIEVGVDVPNATLMVIENPERLGLSQLHQLRGRVGRGAKKSFCVLLFQNPLTEHGRERLKIMRKTNNGFEIANQDLLMRGPGELLGTRQTGAMNFRIADLIRDQGLLPKIHQAANVLMMRHPDIAKQIIDRWQIHTPEYAKV